MVSICVAPRERGWTPVGRVHCRSPMRRPARAGMDPRRSARTTSSRPSPRASGDGPQPGTRSASAPHVAPRERGWTLHRFQTRDLLARRPARAGMDPPSAGHAWLLTPSPRASGDGPSCGMAAWDPDRVAPRERGWTHAAEGLARMASRRPARAGMDLRPARCRPQGRTSPRASGDGPRARPRDPCAHAVAPRERGWTLRALDVARLIGRRPARAGMDPSTLAANCPWRASPRASGDGPYTVGDFEAGGASPRASGDGPLTSERRIVEERVAPRERGWTRPRPRLRATGLRRPARAGMDLKPSPRSGLSLSSPRASGDGPSGVHSITNLAPRRPARAGMDPTVWLSTRACSPSPRASGDGPVQAMPPLVVSAVAPRERGWTLAGEPAAGFAVRRPARAGMDPLLPQHGWRATASPRASGDGPVPHGDGGAGAAVAPRERGWTLLTLAPPQLNGRRPARAGMDPAHLRSHRRGRASPRASGDGPAQVFAAAHHSHVAPRERGWTLVVDGQAGDAARRPARAGMDPGPRASSGEGLPSPRACGDGPTWSSSAVTKTVVAPRERGWTQCRLGHRQRRVRRPARAGMDPSRKSSAAACTTSPRASGDGPRLVTWRAAVACVAPRERGWTHVDPHLRQVAGRRPARAGMDPGIFDCRPGRASSPRASGDGPRSRPGMPSWPNVAPRERGWTPFLSARPRQPSRRPARAGMDPW